MDYKEILVERQDHIATVTLNRPQKLNAYTTLMGEELTHAYNSLGQRDDVCVIKEAVAAFLEKRPARFEGK